MTIQRRMESLPVEVHRHAALKSRVPRKRRLARPPVAR